MSFLVKDSCRTFRVRSGAQHWQLRDLLSAPAHSSQLYFPTNDNSVAIFDVQKARLMTPKNLSFSPTCMRVECGYLAAGGQNSELYVEDLSTGAVVADTTVGDNINNAVTIWQSQSDPTDVRLVVSNNDEHIRVYELSTMFLLMDLRCPAAVNFARLSPDGKFLVAVCDCRETFVFSCNGRTSAESYARLSEANEAGFACDWNSRSTEFAAGFQDGVCAVWDVRSLRPLAKLHSMHAGGRGAVRSVHYCKQPCVDLLMFGEHQAYVHVVDSRTYDSTESVKISSLLPSSGIPSRQDLNICGTAFAADGSRLYVLLPDRLVDVEVDTHIRRVFADGSLH